VLSFSLKKFFKCLVSLIVHAGGDRPSFTCSNSLDVLTIIVISEGFCARVDDHDILESHVFHWCFDTSHQDSRAQFRVVNSYILQENVLIAAMDGRIALSSGEIRPTDGARMRFTYVDIVTLLGGANPDGILTRTLNVNILKCDILHIGITSEFQVDTFVGIFHVSISESHVGNNVTTEAANRQTDSARSNPFKRDVAAGAFDTESVVLAPNVTIVHPDIVSGNIETISVESGHLVTVVVVSICASSGINLAISDFQVIHLMGPERPVRAIMEEDVLNQRVT